MLELTNFDNGTKVLINKNRVIFIEDAGPYRVVMYSLTKENNSKFFVKESIEDITMLL